MTPAPDIAALFETSDPRIYAFVAQLQSTNETLQSMVTTLNQTLASQQKDIAKLTDQISELKQMLFGRSREQLPPIDSEVRRAVEAQELFETEAEAAEATTGDAAEQTQARRRRGRKKSEVARKKKRRVSAPDGRLRCR